MARKKGKKNVVIETTPEQPRISKTNSHVEMPRESTVKEVVLLKDEKNAKKMGNLLIRSFWAVVMLSLFIGILATGFYGLILGPVAVIALVFIVQTLVYREVIQIGVVPSKERQLPWFRSLHWYFLFSTNYFLYGESIIHYYKPVVLVDAFLMPLATYHRFISFGLYMFGFVGFVMGLKKGHYKFQFSHFCWTHMALILIVIQGHFVINNLFEGLIWFVLPVSCVIMNDTMAYFFGFFFGRTPLIRLSPKKTWEGFIGGFFTTMIFAFFVSSFLISPYMTQSLRCQISGIRCSINPVFIQHEYQLHPVAIAFLRLVSNSVYRFVPTQFASILPFQSLTHRSILLYPIQLHALSFAAFASLIAPFGGFFASGVKRAFKLKDFGDSIPGHGGLTDRFDCQFIMGVFSHMYFLTFLCPTASNVGSILEKVVQMNPEQIVEVYGKIGEYLSNQGLMGDY